jgi:hypothetical protein
MPKTNVEHIKSYGEFYLYYTHWAPNSKKILKKIPIDMWPIFTHVRPCAPICELKLNS